MRVPKVAIEAATGRFPDRLLASNLTIDGSPIEQVIKDMFSAEAAIETPHFK